MTTKTLDLNDIERKIFWTLAVCLGVVLSFYLYSVMTLTFAVVDRNTVNAKVHQLANASGALEAEYLLKTNSVTLAYAQELGFHEVSAKYANASTRVAVANPTVKLSIAR